MATYTILDGGLGPQYSGPRSAPFQTNVDCPALVADTHEWKLANTSNVAAPLASTGWAANDILEVFEVPVGFMIFQTGVRCITAEGAACTIDVGNSSATQTHVLTADPNGWQDNVNLNSAGLISVTTAALAWGVNNYNGIVFITDGTVDILWNTAATADCVFDIWASGVRVW